MGAEGEARTAEVAETHISYLFLVGGRAYKLKKPVSLGFLDFSARQAREAACHREVELNRRLAPDVYLGVFDVVSWDGEPCDHLVVMRRMPEDRRLSRLLTSGAEVSDQLFGIARLLADFHARAPSSSSISSAATAEAVRTNWDDSFEQLRPFVGSVLDPGAEGRLEELVHRYIAGRAPLFEGRIAEGHARDGHGDLQADDIYCLEDGPRILDCIEFNDRLRHGDVLADVAFLAMDLERLGSQDLAQRFLSWYSQFSGQGHPHSLADHYVAYRAHVRAKVACLRAAQSDPDAPDQARQLLQLGLGHLERARVRLVLVGGLPGTGKSTLAAAIADRLGWVLLRSDTIRKASAGVAPDQHPHVAYGEGNYEYAHTYATYQEMLAQAEVAMGMGESVVLDASWSHKDQRTKAAELARRVAADTVELRCVAPADTAAARRAERRREGADPSDATAEVAEAIAQVADPWPTAQMVDTTGPHADALAYALEIVTHAQPGGDEAWEAARMH